MSTGPSTGSTNRNAVGPVIGGSRTRRASSHEPQELSRSVNNQPSAESVTSAWVRLTRSSVTWTPEASPRPMTNRPPGGTSVTWPAIPTRNPVTLTAA